MHCWFTPGASGRSPRPARSLCRPQGAGALRGPDGNLWLPSHNQYQSRITPDGVVTFSHPDGEQQHRRWPDGNLWFSGDSNRIGQIAHPAPHGVRPPLAQQRTGASRRGRTAISGSSNPRQPDRTSPTDAGLAALRSVAFSHQGLIQTRFSEWTTSARDLMVIDRTRSRPAARNPADTARGVGARVPAPIEQIHDLVASLVGWGRLGLGGSRRPRCSAAACAGAVGHVQPPHPVPSIFQVLAISS